jgi:ribosome-binding factor A
VVSDGRRPLRIAEDIRDALGSALTAQMSDPRLLGTVITRVEISADLGVAQVYVRILGEPTPRAIRDAVKALGRAAGLLRRVIGTRLRTKRVPELRFNYDEAMDARARVDELLDEIRLEQHDKPKPEGGEGSGS